VELWSAVNCPVFHNFSVPHSHCPVPRYIPSPLFGVPIGCVTCNVHIVGQAIVIWNIQQFDTHPVLCELDEGNFVVFCAAQRAQPVHLPVYLLIFFVEYIFVVWTKIYYRYFYGWYIWNFPNHFYCWHIDSSCERFLWGIWYCPTRGLKLFLVCCCVPAHTSNLCSGENEIIDLRYQLALPAV